MAVSNSTDGIGVKIDCGLGVLVHENSFSGSDLSSLNTNEIWVENLTSPEVDAVTVRYALLLPLQATVGLLEIQYNIDAGQWTSNFYPLEGINKPCRSLFIQKVFETIYAVCIYMTATQGTDWNVYEISLESNPLSETAVNFENIPLLSGSEFTNVVYANLDGSTSEQNFFVVRDGIVSYVNPLDHGSGNGLVRLEFDECTNFTCTEVNYIGNWILLVCCLCYVTDQSSLPYGVYYDVDRDDLSGEVSKGAILYACPDRAVVAVNVSTHRIQYKTEPGSTEEYDLEGGEFRVGLCFNSSSATWFAYQDTAGRIFVTDMPSSNGIIQLSENGCLNPFCNPIANVSDILVIQETVNGQVVAKGIRTENNYSTVYEVSSVHPNFFALLDYPQLVRPNTSSSSSSMTVTHLPSHLPSLTLPSVTVTPSPSQNGTVSRSKISTAVIVAIVSAVVIVIDFVATTLLGVIVCCRHRYRDRR